MMKINMQFIALALALLFLNVNGASAQDRSYEGTIRIEPVRLDNGERVRSYVRLRDPSGL